MHTAYDADQRMPLTTPRIDLCPDCGNEWPSRFGSHNCNFSRRYVHNRAIVSQPGSTLLDSVKHLANRLEDESCKSAEYADMGGKPSPYPAYLGDIDATIGYLKQFRASIQRLGGHTHRWNEEDYCSICGADGRA